MKILVTGATGQLGSKVVETLLKSVPAQDIAVSVRNPEKAGALRERGVDVRHGDFDAPDTLVAAFSGVDRLLIISADGDNETRVRQHTDAVSAAKEAGVGFIAYTSLANASESTMLLYPPHRAAEEAILKTGIPYSFLRNNWYFENEIGNIQSVMAGGPWITSAGTGRAGWALRQDYADAAAAVLSGNGHENSIYELSGPLLTQAELASAVGEVLGKEVVFEQVTDDAYGDAMKAAGVPDFVISLLVGIQQGIREGALEIESNDFERILGRPVTPLREALRQIVNHLSK